MGLPTTEAKHPSRMTGEARRDQIVDVAIRLFSQKGFRGTTTKEIAVAAGVNEAIIFRHFATKKELYSAILDKKACSATAQGFEGTIDELMERNEDRAVFESIAIHILDVHEQDDAFARLFLYSALEKHELADMFYRNHISNRYRRLANFIERRIHEGVYREVDPMSAACAFIGMIVYHAQVNKFYGRQLLDIPNRDAAQRFTDIFFHGTLLPRKKRRARAESTR